MKNKISCYIVRDLLPTYIDGLTCEETAADIREHLGECTECSDILREMQEGERRRQQEKAEQDINYLKKVKKKTQKTIFTIILIAVIVLLIPAFCFGIIGTSDSAFDCDLTVDGNTLLVEGMLWSSNLAVSNASASDEDGVVYMEVHSVLPIFYRSESFDFSYSAQEDIKRVMTSDGRVLWEDGVSISKYASDIYMSKTEYIGDNSAVGALLDTLNIQENLYMNYHIALQTSEKPYGLTIYSEEPLTSIYVSDDYMEAMMKKYACVILACIDNLGYVSYEYISAEGEPQMFSFTVEGATAFTGKNIKEWSENEKGIQTLLNCLNLSQS